MSIVKNISHALRWYKEANKLSMNELAKELGIAVSSLQGYMDGTANPRTDTIELLAEKMHLSIIEMVSAPAPECEQAETMIRAARAIADLSSEKREEGIQLFLKLVALFSGEA